MTDVPDSPLTFHFPGDYTIREEAIGYTPMKRTCVLHDDCDAADAAAYQARGVTMPECPSCFRDLLYDDMMTHDVRACRERLRAVVDAANALRQFYGIGQYEDTRYLTYERVEGSGTAMIALLDALDALKSS